MVVAGSRARLSSAGRRAVRVRSRASARRLPGSHVPPLRKVRAGGWSCPRCISIRNFIFLFFFGGGGANSTGKIFMDLLKCAETTTLKSSIKIKEEYCSTATLGKLKDLRTNQSAIWLLKKKNQENPSTSPVAEKFNPCFPACLRSSV